MSSDRSGSNVTWHASQVSPQERSQRLGHRSAVLWFTGLSGSGKSTLAMAVERALIDQRLLAYTLDGDNLRHGLCRDLGFSEADRRENIRRAASAAALLADAGVVVLVSLISPYRADRDQARDIIGAERFLEIFVDTPLEICEARDPKGLYQRARKGEIKDFTGIDAPYEAPLHAAVRISPASLEAQRNQVLATVLAQLTLDSSVNVGR